MPTRAGRVFTLALAGLVLALGSSPALPVAVHSEGPTETSESIRTERLRGATATTRMTRGGAHEDLAPPVDPGDTPDLAAGPTPSTGLRRGVALDDGARAHRHLGERAHPSGPRSPPPLLAA